MRGVSILIVNYYTARFVEDLVESVRSNIKRFGYEILVLDNSVENLERERLARVEADDVRVITPQQNLGFVGANNQLFRLARFEIILLLNPDTRLIDDTVEDLLEYVLDNKHVGVAGPMLLNADGSYQVSYYRFPTLWTLCKEHLFLWRTNPYTYASETNETRECDVVKGTCLAIRATVANEVSLFDPELVMYSEEVDLCMRLKKQGYVVAYFPTAKILHFGEQSSTKEVATEYSLYHYYRSKLILFKKHYPSGAARLASWVLCISLLEKAIALRVFNKRTSSRNHFRVFQRLYVLREA
jgi:GT2 family glycosyltransferase